MADRAAGEEAKLTAMNTRTCPNCGSPCGPDDVFCENCGYDFITGSMPSEGDAVADPGEQADATPPVAPSVLDATGGVPADVPRVRLSIAVDRAYFDEVVNEGEIDFPDPTPEEAELDLAGRELHIGRTSDSRAIHPDVDVAELTGDQAVSSRHAVLRASGDGEYTITDVGSTNGTFLDAIDSEAISPGDAVEVKPGTPIYVGAWTRITIVA